MIGQLHQPERDLLYNTVIETTPTICLECGTWKGGGSTYFITSALAKNNKGVLHTFETNREFFDCAVNTYTTEVSHLLPFIHLYMNDFYQSVLNLKFTNIDFCFFDGPEDSEYSMKILKLVEERMNPDGIIILHDWKSKPGSKCFIVQPYLLSSSLWEQVCILNTEVGIAKFRKK
jgi:predicted O-methyltransferase YrrM